MKKIILSLSLLLLATTSSAFDAGTYVCTNPYYGDMTYTLKSNGRAKVKSAMGTERGNWQDDDDAAIIIKKGQIMEDHGNGHFSMAYGTISCKKIK